MDLFPRAPFAALLTACDHPVIPTLEQKQSTYISAQPSLETSNRSTSPIRTTHLMNSETCLPFNAALQLQDF